MDEKKYRLPGRTSLSLPVDDVDRLLRLADGDSALLYLHILRTGGSLIPSLAAQALSRTEEENGLTLRLENFYDEAWLLLRLNGDRRLESITGATYQGVAENLYLLSCTSDTVSIRYQQGGNS